MKKGASRRGTTRRIGTGEPANRRRCNRRQRCCGRPTTSRARPATFSGKSKEPRRQNRVSPCVCVYVRARYLCSRFPVPTDRTRPPDMRSLFISDMLFRRFAIFTRRGAARPKTFILLPEIAAVVFRSR